MLVIIDTGKEIAPVDYTEDHIWDKLMYIAKERAETKAFNIRLLHEEKSCAEDLEYIETAKTCEGNPERFFLFLFHESVSRRQAHLMISLGNKYGEECCIHRMNSVGRWEVTDIETLRMLKDTI